MFRFTFFYLIFLLAVFPVFASSTAYGADSPEKALTDIQEGIDSRNTALVEQRMDMNALLNQGVTVFFERLKNKGTSSLPPALALITATASTPQLQESLRSLLVQEAGSFVRYGVESGHFAGKPVPGSKPSGLMAPLLNDASLGKKELRATGKSRKDGKTMRMPAKLTDHGNGKTYTLDLRLAMVNGQWRVTELCNMNSLVKTVQKEIAE